MNFRAFLQTVGENAGRSRLEREARQKQQEENILKMLQAGFARTPQPNQQGATGFFDRLNQGLNYRPEMDPAPIFEMAGHHPAKIAEARRTHEASESAKGRTHAETLADKRHTHEKEILRLTGQEVPKELKKLTDELATVEAQINLARKNNDREVLPVLLEQEEKLRNMIFSLKEMEHEKTKETHKGEMSALQFLNSDAGKEFTRMQRMIGLTKDLQGLDQERYTFIEKDGKVIANDKFTGESKMVHTVSEDANEKLMTGINQLLIIAEKAKAVGGDYQDILETPEFEALIKDIISGGAIAEQAAKVLGGEGDEKEDPSMTVDMKDGEVVPEEEEVAVPTERTSPQGRPLGGSANSVPLYEQAGYSIDELTNQIKEYLKVNLRMDMVKRSMTSPVLQGRNNGE